MACRTPLPPDCKIRTHRSPPQPTAARPPQRTVPYQHHPPLPDPPKPSPETPSPVCLAWAADEGFYSMCKDILPKRYQSPELARGNMDMLKKIPVAADWWALGCTVFEIFCGQVLCAMRYGVLCAVWARSARSARWTHWARWARWTLHSCVAPPAPWALPSATQCGRAVCCALQYTTMHRLTCTALASPPMTPSHLPPLQIRSPSDLKNIDDMPEVPSGMHADECMRMNACDWSGDRRKACGWRVPDHSPIHPIPARLFLEGAAA